MHIRKLIAPAMLIALCACSAKIDTSSPDAYAKSVQAVTKDLPAAERDQFRDALVVIAFNAQDPKDTPWAGADPASPIFLAAKDKIAGKSAKDVIKLGIQTRIGLIDQKIAGDAATIQHLATEKAKYASIFNSITLSSARYSAPANILGMAEPEIAFTISNNSKIAIKKIYVSGVLKSPGRAVPWIASDFNYEFPGGLEPGETKSLDLQPNMFGDWKADDSFSNRKDLQLELTLANATGANDQPLLPLDAPDPKALETEVKGLQKTKAELSDQLNKV